MRKAYFIICLLVSCVIIYNCSAPKGTIRKQVGNPYPTRIFDSTPSVEYLNPEQSLKSFNLPAGYHLELVASEPMIKEPVAIAWDGNARMYVAEMLTRKEPYFKKMITGWQMLIWSINGVVLIGTWIIIFISPTTRCVSAIRMV